VDISEASASRHRILIFHVAILVLVLTLLSVGPVLVNQNGSEEPTPSVVFPTPKSLVPMAPNKPPVAVVTPNSANVLVNERTVLSARDSTDMDGSIIEYRWSFGARGVVFGPEITLKFTEPGSETIVLTVVDDDGGTSSAIASIEILPRSAEAVLILSAGPDNTLQLRAGTDGTVFMEIAAYGQRISGLEVEILDDGGLDVSVGDLPQKLRPGERIELQIEISARDAGKDSAGSIVLLRAVSEQTTSDVERIQVMVQSPSTQASLSEEFVELLVVVLGFSALLIIIELWKKKR
jgi:hypothetical protein